MSVENIDELELEDVVREIAWRKKVLPDLVGSLYPEIIWQDLSILRSKQYDLEKNLGR